MDGGAWLCPQRAGGRRAGTGSPTCSSGGMMCVCTHFQFPPNRLLTHSLTQHSPTQTNHSVFTQCLLSHPPCLPVRQPQALVEQGKIRYLLHSKVKFKDSYLFYRWCTNSPRLSGAPPPPGNGSLEFFFAHFLLLPVTRSQYHHRRHLPSNQSEIPSTPPVPPGCHP